VLHLSAPGAVIEALLSFLTISLLANGMARYSSSSSDGLASYLGRQLASLQVLLPRRDEAAHMTRD
jgi:hypothetical protein